MFNRVKLEFSSVVKEIFDHIPEKYFESETATFLDTNVGSAQYIHHLVNILRKYGHNDDNIRSRVFGLFEYEVDRNYILNKYPTDTIGTFSVGNFCDDNSKFGKRRFTVTLNCPPFSDGNVKLYARYFEKSLDISELVVSIMPVKLISNQVTVKKHNERIKRHMIHLSDDISHHFVGMTLTNIRYVIASKKQNNTIKDDVDPLDTMPLLYPKRERLVPRKGCSKVNAAKEVKRGTTSIQKVLKGEAILRTISTADANESYAKSKAPWLVLVYCTRAKGKFNSVIMRNDGKMVWSQSIFAYEAESKSEAERIEEWLNSREIQKEVEIMLQIKGNLHTLSQQMMKRLPSYE